MIKLWFKLATKYVHPGDSHLRAWDNHPEHCHSRDQVIIVMIMTGNDHIHLSHHNYCLSRDQVIIVIAIRIVTGMMNDDHVFHFSISFVPNFSSLCETFQHSRDQVIIVIAIKIRMINSPFPFLLFQTFFHCVEYFQIYATWPHPRGHVWNPAVHGISQLPLIINYDRQQSCAQWSSIKMVVYNNDGAQVYQNKESQAYISTNFTTKPNTPGR